MNNDQRKQIEDKLRKREFAELSKKPGIWIRGTTPNMRTVDLTKLSTVFPGLPVVCISTGIERIEQGHGITEIDDIRDEIAGILKHKGTDEQKEQPAPKEYILRHPPGDTVPEPIDREKLKEAFKKIEEKTSEPKGDEKMEEKKEEKGLVPQEKAKLPAKAKLSDHELEEKIERAKARRFTSGQGDFYKVQGKERPDSAMIQKLANESGISVEITKAEQTDKYAHVEVVGIFGNLRVPAVVHHDFDTEFMLKTMEIIAKNPTILDHYEGLNPVIKDGATIKQGDEVVDAKYYLIHTLLSFKKFSLRDACTKAMSIVELKLLNQEFRDEDEIKSEMDEKALVESLKKKK